MISVMNLLNVTRLLGKNLLCRTVLMRLCILDVFVAIECSVLTPGLTTVVVTGLGLNLVGG